MNWDCLQGIEHGNNCDVSVKAAQSINCRQTKMSRSVNCIMGRIIEMHKTNWSQP